jgi:hypothetical protein
MSDFVSQFSKYEFTPERVRLLEIQDHMRRTINDVALLFAQTWHGFSLLRSHLESERQSLLAQLKEMFPADEAERHYNVVSQLLVPYHAAEDLTLAPVHGTLQSFHADTTADSPHLRTLTSSLLIALNAYWEHSWRPDISAAIGSPNRKDWIQSDFWGEVCKIRDCILHNKARANTDYQRRAKILKWFKDGDSIEITSAMFTIFISQARAYCETFVVEFYDNRPNA